MTVRSLLPVHERGTAYHLTFEHLHNHSTCSRNIWNPTSFNCLFPACRACDYVYADYVRRSRSSSCRLLRPINCQTYITLHSATWSWYTGLRRCYIWYSEDGTRRDCSPPRPLLAVPKVTTQPSTASVPISVFLYSGPLLCGFNAAIRALTARLRKLVIETNGSVVGLLHNRPAPIAAHTINHRRPIGLYSIVHWLHVWQAARVRVQHFSFASE